MSDPQEVTTPKKIESYADYLSIFFPNLAPKSQPESTTPEEVGKKLAQDTLSHIQHLLQKIKPANR